LDDDPTNRQLVRALVPEVETPELPADPREYTKFLHAQNYFNQEALTDEDKMRGNLYVTERLRKEQEKQFENREDFLTSLNLELSVYEDDDSCIPRLAQLTEKTNQFNTLKHPFTEDDIRSFITSDEHKIFHGQLQDTFGDYGVVVFALVDIKKDEWHIRSMLMSCRVFGRDVEEVFLGEIIKRAHKEGAKRVTIAFAESEKNAPAKEFVSKHFKEGYVEVKENPSQPAWVTVTTL
jgi:FkbH-like protein